MVDRSIIGKESEPEFHEVEKGAIRKFAAAIGDENRLFYDEAYAKERGYTSLVAPLTFPTTFRGKVQEWFFKLDKSKLLHGGQEYEYERRIIAGETIKMVEMVSDIYKKSGKNGEMLFIIRDRSGFDIENNKVFNEKSTFIIREGN